jgi:dolichol-phosphate mannosyltransferase
VMDGDLQHDETILPAMLGLLERGEAELVVGSRHVEGGEASAGFSGLRARLSDAATRAAEGFLPVRVADPMSGFFMMPRPLFEEIAPRLNGTGFKILLDLLLSAPRALRVRELPYRFRPRAAGESKLDLGVAIEFAGLLADKAMGGIVPLRFLAFAAVGVFGIFVHMAALALLHPVLGLSFNAAMAGAAFLAMTANFLVNNRITYRDRRLRGAGLLRGLVLFYLVCGIGAFANTGVAALLVRDGIFGWGMAGVAGAVMTVVWNYAMSTTLVWRAAR